MKKNNFLPIIFLLLSLAGCRQQAPVIDYIYPQIGIMGEPVTIRGSFFGSERNESYVTIAGTPPTSRSYLDWNDNEITVRIPEFGEAGLVYVYVNNKKSNGVLFANQATLPTQIRGGGGVGPRIVSITPPSGLIGAPLTITGTGFGGSRGNGGVFFSWIAENQGSAPLEARLQEFTEVAESEFGYELWTDREIRIRVPDGAISGNMEVRNERGVSPPMVFALSGRPGTKTLSNKRSYTLNYSVSVKVGEAESPNTMYLWIPRPADSSAQRNTELLLSSVEPFIEKYRGISLYKMDNLVAGRDIQIRLAWKVDVYSIATSIQAQSVRQESPSPMNEAYTQRTPQFPADDVRMKNQAVAIVGRERNPYLKAQKIYEWITGETLSWVNQAEGGIFNVLETKQTDSYLSALLYCTLLRAADVPCQPVAGILINRDRQTMNHYWAEFWVDGFGWVPVDPAMGAAAKHDGAVPASFVMNETQTDSYFGNIDSQRIAFSRGFTGFSPMDPRGRTVTRNRSYSLQNLWEEVIGGIESYSSLWGDITITGIYVQ